MSNTLHITNGDSAVELMKPAGISGDILPWQDVLHDGPVPANLSLEELSKVRAKFLSDCFHLENEDVLNGFIERDNLLKNSSSYEHITLWFEHDLYDQLQLLQILDWYSGHPEAASKLYIVQTDTYLGMASPEDFNQFLQLETTVTDAQLELAKDAWKAFRSETPIELLHLLEKDTSALPYLHKAIARLLEEYPDAKTHLPRTENAAIQLIKEGERQPGRVFGAWQKTEDPKFMGDWSFFQRLQTCLATDPPLIEQTAGQPLDFHPYPDHRLRVSDFGKQVLNGDAKANIFTKPRWIGGVELSQGSLWLWNTETQTIEKENP